VPWFDKPRRCSKKKYLFMNANISLTKYQHSWLQIGKNYLLLRTAPCSCLYIFTWHLAISIENNIGTRHMLNCLGSPW
jgi:hypothetical protein